MTDEELRIPAILPPYDDGIFQSMLIRPEAEPVLRFVVSGAIEIPLRSVTVNNPQLPLAHAADKNETFDINCEADSGELCEVEMQSNPMRGDSGKNDHAIIRSRSIYNLCDLHSTQPSRGVVLCLSYRNRPVAA